MRPDQCAIVIPSCRTVNAELLEWLPHGIRIFVVSDTDEPIASVREGMRVFDLALQRRVMGADFDLIPRGSSACRNFGFYYAWHHTDYEFVITLDDDVKPGPGFLDGFAHLGERRDFDTATGVDWFNTLELFDGCEGLYPRGFPFAERHGTSPAWATTRARAVCHMGLWDGILDTHAIDKLLFAEYRESRPELSLRRQLVRIGTAVEPARFPLCSMNFGVVRDALPLLYQFPMPAPFVDRYPLGRYEDIWAGYIAQTLIGLCDEAITAGAPVVRHLKNGDIHKEIAGEHFGALVSPYLYGVVDEAAGAVRPGSYLDMYGALADRVLTRGLPRTYRDYIERAFRSVARWCELHALSGSARARPERISGA